MKDSFILALFVYLSFASLLIGTLPDDFFVGNQATTPTETIDGTNDITLADGSGSLTSANSSISYLEKILRFIFAGITIDGLPFIFAGIVNIFNVITFGAVSMWIINKLRGISG